MNTSGKLDEAAMLAGLPAMAAALDARGMGNAALYMRTAAEWIARKSPPATPPVHSTEER